MDAELFQLVTEFECWRVRYSRWLARTQQTRPSGYFSDGVTRLASDTARVLKDLEQTDQTRNG